jgi:lysophospholipase L1-like esterase
MLAGRLGMDYAELNLKFLNLGISGNRVTDLKARWKEDCLDYKPDILSIFIGINDTWRKYDSNNPTSAESYKEDYRFILEEARSKLDCQIVIIEPFVLQFPEDRKAWREDLDPKIQAARELSLEYADAFVPLDGIFASAVCRQEPAFWAADGVHPTCQGHALITETWLECTGL